jgi:hypothetical protein
LRLNLFRPLASGLLGITLLMPASFFMLTLLARIGFGSRTLYYSIAPSFLQSPFDLFAWHRTPAQFILGCVLLAILFNVMTLLDLRLERGRRGWEICIWYRRHSHWLNTAVALQGALLLVMLVAYTMIQHVRY